MPIQCTDGTAEGGESPVPSGLQRGLAPQPPCAPLAPQPPRGPLAPQPPRGPLAPLDPRGAEPEDRDLDESLTKLSVKFPPSTDSEYEFLNSTPDRQGAHLGLSHLGLSHLGLSHLGLSPGKRPPICSIATALDEEMSGELSTQSSSPPSPSHPYPPIVLPSLSLPVLSLSPTFSPSPGSRLQR